MIGPHEARPCKSRVGPRSPRIAPSPAARTAPVRCAAAASALLRSKGKPGTLGLIRSGMAIQPPARPSTMPNNRRAERSLVGGEQGTNPKTMPSTTSAERSLGMTHLAILDWAANLRGGGSNVNDCVPWGKGVFCCVEIGMTSLEHDPARPNWIFSKRRESCLAQVSNRSGGLSHRLPYQY